MLGALQGLTGLSLRVRRPLTIRWRTLVASRACQLEQDAVALGSRQAPGLPLPSCSPHKLIHSSSSHSTLGHRRVPDVQLLIPEVVAGALLGGAAVASLAYLGYSRLHGSRRERLAWGTSAEGATAFWWTSRLLWGRRLREEQQPHPYVKVIEEIGDHLGSDWDIKEPLPGAPELPCPASLTWVDSKTGLRDLALELSRARRFAFDCEHNALRSYRGMTCLLQISTGSHDYVIDCLALGSKLAAHLGGIFANPSVCKVVHGGENDVMWLQRDFGIYVVNLHDTQKIAAAASYPSLSLAHLLLQLCGVHTNKSFQAGESCNMSPWYARLDVRYLLHIHDRLVVELRASKPRQWQQKLAQANRRSQAATLSTYSQVTHEEAVRGSATALLRLHLQQQRGSGGDIARDCFYALCRWRDNVAREVDEGVQYVLPDEALTALATGGRLRSGRQLLDVVAANLPQTPQLHDFGHCSKAAEVSRVLTERNAEVFALLSKAQRGNCPWTEVDMVELSGKASTQKNNKAEEEKQAAQKKRIVAKFSAKSPVYENCRMLSQEGELLCHCDKKKMLWYVKKGLADRVEGEENTIQLRFQHKTSDQDSGDAFYSTSRCNRCVVCGETGHYLRYRIVPSCYRRNFPTHLKSHRSHDIVLVCVVCHEAAQKSADEIKRELAAQHGITLNPPPTVPPTMGSDEAGNGKCSADAEMSDAPSSIPEAQQRNGIHPFNARRAAQALSQHATTMPDGRRQELENLIKVFLGRDPSLESPGLRPGDLEAARVAGVSVRRRKRVLQQLARDLAVSGAKTAAGGGGEAAHGAGLAPFVQAAEVSGKEILAIVPGPASDVNGGHAWHGENVVARLLEEGGDDALLDLVQRFRRRFVERLSPRYLPHGWEVDHCARREFGEHSVFFTESHGEGSVFAAIETAGQGGVERELPLPGSRVDSWGTFRVSRCKVSFTPIGVLCMHSSEATCSLEAGDSYLLGGVRKSCGCCVEESEDALLEDACFAAGAGGRDSDGVRRHELPAWGMNHFGLGRIILRNAEEGWADSRKMTARSMFSIL